jgi:putative Holliday junction resolvase
MRVLGVDLGTRRIGVAVSDGTGTIASPLTVVARSGDVAADHRRIAALVIDEDAERVIVGLPLSMSGTAGPAAQSAMAESETLAAALPVPVELWDERLTTVVADRSMIARGKRAPARRKVVDQVAAAVILQSWLDAHR